jgi:hypothetical protein
LVCVDGVEVRRRMIGEIHPDHDPIEATDRRRRTSALAAVRRSC